MTSVLAAPICMATSILAFCATWRTTPRTSYFLNPGATTVRLYVPGGNAATAHSPAELVTVVRLMPRVVLFMATCALAMLAPLGSCTVPTMVDVS